jgi:hypothetical protein
MTIVQPRLDNLSEHELSVPELLAWAEKVLHPAALEAYNGGGKQNPGDWCKFCKIKSCCCGLAAMSQDTAKKYEDFKTVDAQTLAKEILPKLDLIKSWCSSVEEYALQRALAGQKYEGYKIVEGRSNRKITDSGAVEHALFAAGYEYKEFQKPSELCSITELEKLCGKKRFQLLCGEYISKPHGKPTLVPVSDKREEYNSAVADFDGIEFNS